MQNKSIVLAITGSNCNFDKVLAQIEKLAKKYNVLPIMSPAADQTTRFGDIEVFKEAIEKLTKNKIQYTIVAAEKFSSDKTIVAVVICPATGNTAAKLANAITDSPTLMAAKAVTRNNKPCVIAVSTNDGLSNNFENIGALLNKKNYYFVPFNQDDYVNKPNSLACNFDLVADTLEHALQGEQLQPIIYKK